MLGVCIICKIRERNNKILELFAALQVGMYALFFIRLNADRCVCMWWLLEVHLHLWKPEAVEVKDEVQNEGVAVKM